MKQWLVWIGAATVSLALVGCGSSNKTEIPKMAINTENARLSAFLEGIQDESCSPLCTKITREADVEEEVVVDEALLIEAGKNTCFDVTVRTTLGYDRPVSEFAPTCRFDASPVVGSVDQEKFTVFAYGDLSTVSSGQEGGASSEFAVLAADMTNADLNAKAGEETTPAKYFGTQASYTAEQLRIVERKAKVCCPGTGQTTIELNLSNGVDPAMEGEDLAQAVDFVWFLTE